jgi:ribosomal protein S18 acetylase RimI-like enzyme
MHELVVQELRLDELLRVREIDRSESASGFFVLEDGSLRLVERDLEIPTWDDAEFADTIDRLTATLAGGGVVLAIADGPRLVAAAALGGELLAGEERRLELVFLHVSRSHRRLGLARQLLDEVCSRARARGAEQLYVSSSDVEPAVRFYLGYGCVPAARTDPAIVERWPTDIHLTLKL